MYNFRNLWLITSSGFIREMGARSLQPELGPIAVRIISRSRAIDWWGTSESSVWWSWLHVCMRERKIARGKVLRNHHFVERFSVDCFECFLVLNRIRVGCIFRKIQIAKLKMHSSFRESTKQSRGCDSSICWFCFQRWASSASLHPSKIWTNGYFE